MKSKTLKNYKTSRKKYGGMHKQGSRPHGSKTRPRGSQAMPRGSQKSNSKEQASMPQASMQQASMPQASMPQASMPQASMPQIDRIKPLFEEEFKAYCINNFIDSGYIYDEYTEILPGIYKDDTKKRNTMYLLIFIISMLSVMLKDKCKIIIKGGLAVLFAVSSHQEPIHYSTKDIDLLIKPLDDNDGLFHAQFIGNMIMWIFDEIDERRFNKLSLLDESAREMQEKQLLKISMINDTGKFSAVIDINIHLPDDKRFYSPDEKYTFTTYNEDGFGPVLFHEKQPFLFFASKKALIFDRMLHLLKYNHLIKNVSYIESIAMDVIKKYPRGSSLDDVLPNMGLMRRLNEVEKDDVRQKIYELSTKKSKTHKADPNEIYLASIKKSLTALILENIVSHTKTSNLRQSILKLSALSMKTKEDVFDQFLDDSIKKHNSLTIADSNIRLTTEQRDKLKRYILS
jgi:hypothetical protein